MAFRVAQVHAVAFAVTPELAVSAFPLFHPAAVAILSESVLPYLPEIITIYISLPVVRADAGTRPDTAVQQNRTDGYTCGTFKKSIAGHSLITA